MAERNHTHVRGRPGVEKAFVSAQMCPWGTLIECKGTQSDLLASGVAQPYMFDNMSRSGVRTRSDEFGDSYLIRRRPKGIWELTLHHGREPGYEDITEPRASKRKWYPEAKANVDHAVEEIIARARRKPVKKCKTTTRAKGSSNGR